MVNRLDRVRAMDSRIQACLVLVSALALGWPRLALAAPHVEVLVPHASDMPVANPDFQDLSRTSPRALRVAGEARGDAHGSVLTMCVTVEASGWVDEAEPIAFERLTALAAGAVTRARGKAPAWHIEALTAAAVPHTRRRELGGDPGETAEATLFLGFAGAGGHDALACYAASFGTAPSARAARFVGPFVPEPEPGVGLMALVWTVHHPRATLAFGATLSLVLALAYVRTRPRPKTS